MITENIKNTSVYLIKAGQTDNYKIGIATNTSERLSNLQTAHYEKLILIHTVYETAMKELVQDGRIEMKTGRGYYALVDLATAIKGVNYGN